MDYRNNGNGSYTYFCEDCGKEEAVQESGAPRRIKPFSKWCGEMLPKMDLTWHVRARMGEWLSRWGGRGLCRRCATRKLKYCMHHQSPEEQE